MRLLQIALSLFSVATAHCDNILFEDAFTARPADGWAWRDELPDTQRSTAEGLQIRSLPGNLWGGMRDIKTWLLRPLPTAETFRTEVTVRATPKREYEQAGLLWQTDDDNYIKIVQEWLQGKLVVNFVREEKAAPKIVANTPIDSESVQLRLTRTADSIVAEFRTKPNGPWQTLGTCAPLTSSPSRVGIGTMQGENSSDRWATFSQFRITTVK